MKSLKILAAVLALFIAFAAPVGILSAQPAQAASGSKISANVQVSLNDLRREVPDSQEVLSKAKGILVFPKVYQAGFVFGGKFGEGALLVGGKTVDYYNVASGSWGLQIGAQRKGLIICFMNDDALSQFRNSGGWEIGPNAGVTVVNVGAEGKLDLTALNQPILAFVVGQKGLMGGITLEGTKVTKIKK